MSNDHIYTDTEMGHIEELSSAYALGALTEDAEGLKEFETLVESGDPVLSKSLEQMLIASVAIASAVPQVEPPASIRASLLQNVAELKKTQSTTASGPKTNESSSQDAIRLKRRTRYFIGTSILSGLLICILLAINVSNTAKLDRSNDLMKALLHQTDSLRSANQTTEKPADSLNTAPPLLKTDNEQNQFFSMFGEQDARLVTMASAPLGTLREHLFFSPKQKTIALLKENLPALNANQTYELWATVGSKSPIAIGTFRVDPKSGGRIINFHTKLKAADSFAISIEHGKGGNSREGKVIFTGDVPKTGIN